MKFIAIIVTISIFTGCTEWNSFVNTLEVTISHLEPESGKRIWSTELNNKANSAKEIFSTSFNGKVVYQNRNKEEIFFPEVEIPPQSETTIVLKTYCMDEKLPAPKTNEKMHLVATKDLIDNELLPVYHNVIKHSHLSSDYQQNQRIIWSFRNLYDEKKGTFFHQEDYHLLNSLSPDASKQIASVKQKKELQQKIIGYLQSIFSDKIVNSVSEANQQVDEILANLESISPQGKIPQNNSDHTLLAPGIAVKTIHHGGARTSQLIIRNTTDTPYQFDATKYSLESERETQRLALGGIKEIEQKTTSNAQKWKNLAKSIIENAKSNQEVNKKITCAYAEIYAQNKNFKWAGLAAIVSGEIGNTRLLNNVAPLVANKFYNHVYQGNKSVFEDLYWQHLAYQNGGLEELEKIYSQKELPEELWLAWNKIAMGDTWGGNKDLLRYEQKYILQSKMYAPHPTLWNWADLIITSPVPGDNTKFPGQNISNLDERWKWIKEDILPSWKQFEENPANYNALQKAIKDVCPQCCNGVR